MIRLLRPCSSPETHEIEGITITQQYLADQGFQNYYRGVARGVSHNDALWLLTSHNTITSSISSLIQRCMDCNGTMVLAVANVNKHALGHVAQPPVRRLIRFPFELNRGPVGGGTFIYGHWFSVRAFGSEIRNSHNRPCLGNRADSCNIHVFFCQKSPIFGAHFSVLRVKQLIELRVGLWSIRSRKCQRKTGLAWNSIYVVVLLLVAPAHCIAQPCTLCAEQIKVIAVKAKAVLKAPKASWYHLFKGCIKP